jgi:hypothetical protein
MDYSDSDGEIPDLTIRLQPYMFQPVGQNNTTQRDASSNSDNERESDTHTDDQVEIFEDAPDAENLYYICLYLFLLLVNV